MPLPSYRSLAWYADRRRRLKHAAGLRSMTLAQCAAHFGVTHTHLNFVLRGHRQSARLDDAIAALLAWAYGPAIGRHYGSTPPEDQ